MIVLHKESKNSKEEILKALSYELETDQKYKLLNIL